MSASGSQESRTMPVPEPVGIPTDAASEAAHKTTSAKDRLRNIAQKKVIPYITLVGSYKYKPINADEQIRILRLLPAVKKNDRIRCTLLTKPFPSSSKSPLTFEYEALSYWWGDGQAREEIVILEYNAEEGETRPTWDNIVERNFFIRSNLNAALQQLRSNSEEIDIWVDAICIHQDNDAEKTAQVRRMNEIYAEAKTVCIWLGEGNNKKIIETFKFLREILDLKELDRITTSEKEVLDKWPLVLDLMTNRWFSRRWVIQELALAKHATVQWGTEEMLWVDFADAIALCMTKHDQVKSKMLHQGLSFPMTHDPFEGVRALGANTLVHATNNLFRKGEDGKIQQRLLTLEILVSCLLLAFEATEPRDTIYAVLSIAKDTSSKMSQVIASTGWISMMEPESEGFVSGIVVCALKVLGVIEYAITYVIQFIFHVLVLAATGAWSPKVLPEQDKRISPDYHKSLVDVCADFMEYCIETSQSLDILCRHWAPPPKERHGLEKLKLPAEEKMPSWIPSIKGHAFGAPGDQSKVRINGDSFVGSLERENQQHYSASRELRPWVKFGRCKKANRTTGNTSESAKQPSSDASLPLPSISDGTLCVKGFRLDVIEKMSGRVSYGVVQYDSLEMGGWPKGCKAGEVPERLWRTLVADRGPNGINAPSWYHRACLQCLKQLNPNGDLNIDGLMKLKGVPDAMRMYLERVQSIIHNRRFFKSGQKQLFGLAPPETEIGDWICILYGCSVPVVLRPDVKTGKQFKFIGECYVHGMMDGEAIPAQTPKFPYRNSEKFILV